MNFGKKINEIGSKLAIMETELDLLMEMDYLEQDKIDKIKQEHTLLGNELIDLERVMKNRIWQQCGLERYKEFEKSFNSFEKE
jgi:hypothetical protein